MVAWAPLPLEGEVLRVRKLCFSFSIKSACSLPLWLNKRYEIDLQSFRAVGWHFASVFLTLGFAHLPFEQLLVSRCSVQLRMGGAVPGPFLLLGKVEETPERLHPCGKTAAAAGNLHSGRIVGAGLACT